MKTLNALKLRIMTRAFRIRIANGEDFADIAADYPALTTDDLEAIREALNMGRQSPHRLRAQHRGASRRRRGVETGLSKRRKHRDQKS